MFRYGQFYLLLTCFITVAVITVTRRQPDRRDAGEAAPRIEGRIVRPGPLLTGSRAGRPT